MTTLAPDPFAIAFDLLAPEPREDTPLEADWRVWLPAILGDSFRSDFAPHHAAFWQWVWAIELGVRPSPSAHVSILARGGGKSSSLEAACVALGARKRRRYVLYVSGTQDQADDHVGSIQSLLESAAVAREYPEMASRLLTKFGASKGWRRNRLRTASGFTIDALGLDTAARGVKLENQRPDGMVVDDVDDTEDSDLTTEKKVRRITRKLLPAGSTDLAVMAGQNLVKEDGVFGRLAGTSTQPGDFLSDRVVVGPIKAVEGLEVAQEDVPAADDGPPVRRWKITAGAATWAGQSLEVAEHQINEWGLDSFLAEAQHETVARSSMFPVDKWRFVDGIPFDSQLLRRWDLANTEKKRGSSDPDWTASVLMALDAAGRIYVVDARRIRAEDAEVEAFVRAASEWDMRMAGRKVPVMVEQEPGSSGKFTARYFATRVLAGFNAGYRTSAQDKVARAGPLASQQQLGNCFIVRDTLRDPDEKWNQVLIDEYRRFNNGGRHDDLVDAGALAYEDLTGTGGDTVTKGGSKSTGLQGRR